jgi:hypothetical protein
MNKIIYGFLISVFIIMIPLVSAGYVQITPNPASQGSVINITIYPSYEPMGSWATIHYKPTGQYIGQMIDFDCEHFRCYEQKSAEYFIDKTMQGDFYLSIYDYDTDKFIHTDFKVIQNTCNNGIKDNDETDIDCGGNKCKKCSLDKDCILDPDCVTDKCENNKCIEESIIFEKNKEKYSDSELFLVSDEDWKSVLKLVPLSIWKQEDGIEKFPVLIYHKEKNNFDIDSTIRFIKEYSPEHITIFGETPEKVDKLLVDDKIGSGINKENITKTDFNDYYSYWNEFNGIVISEEDYKTGIIASLFASYQNIPLIFENEIDYGLVKDKEVYVVGNISEYDLENIKRIAKSMKVYSRDELQKEYIGLTQTNKVIVVNSNDIKTDKKNSFRTEKSSKIKETYSKDSLSSVFLGAGKNEIIIFVDINESPDNSDCMNNKNISENHQIADESIEKEINDLDFNPKYITIFASPYYIPDSIFEKCHETGQQYRENLDWKYATINNELINFGRIYGITSSDSSSYVARDLFYEELKLKDASGLFIGHSFERYSDNMKSIYDATTDSGYESLCYTGKDRIGCTTSTKVPSEDYSNKQLILFGDHGFPDEWYQTLKYRDIPELNSSYVFSHACSTNNFWQGGSKLMSTNMIRNGAISYQGAVGISVSDNSELISLQKLTGSNITLGELNKELTEELNNYKKYYEMIGDPTLNLNLKNVLWENNSLSSYDGEIETSSNIHVLNITSEKEIYSPNQDIIIKTIVKNNDDFEKNFNIGLEIFSVSGYVSELETKTINIQGFEEKEINFSMEVLDTIPSEKYYAVVKILGDDKINESRTEFKVTGTLKTNEIGLLVCVDQDCYDESKIFSPNEEIYLDYESIEEIEPSAILIYPNLRQEQINLPYSFSSAETGKYSLIMNYPKQGYQTINEVVEFVISEETEISISETCNNNNVCDNNENEQNCPQDCINVDITDNRTIELREGWNLVSFPVIVSDNSVQTVFHGVLNSVYVGYFNSGKWIFYPQIDEYENLSYIDNKKSYFIKSESDSRINFDGDLLQDNELELKQGINLVSYPCKNEKNISLVFKDIIDDIESIETIDNGAKTFDPNNPKYSDLETLKPNKGYIVIMKNKDKMEFKC